MSGMRRDWIYPYGATSAAEPKNLSCTVQAMWWQRTDKRGCQLMGRQGCDELDRCYFIAALITVIFAVYSDVTMTHCEAKSFFGTVGLCTPLGKQ